MENATGERDCAEAAEAETLSETSPSPNGESSQGSAPCIGDIKSKASDSEDDHDGKKSEIDAIEPGQASQHDTEDRPFKSLIDRLAEDEDELQASDGDVEKDCESELIRDCEFR